MIGRVISNASRIFRLLVFIGTLLFLILILYLIHCFVITNDWEDKVLYYQDNLEIMYQRQAQNLPSGSLLFFGDSHIQGLAVTAISPKAVNFGIGHLQLQRLAQNIGSYPNLAYAEKIIIGIGINDLLQTTLSEPKKVIRQLIDALQCCSNKVVLLSVLPVNEITLQRPGFNLQIQQFNQQLKEAALMADIRFIDNFTAFTDNNGQLSSHYDLGDGLHLTENAYALMIQQIKSGLQQGNRNEG